MATLGAKDSARREIIAPGVVHRSYRLAAGPWAVELLDVDLTRCLQPVAVKAGGAAVGRARTSELLTELRSRASEGAIGGVNADFFSFTPPGVPATAHVERGVLIAGPSERPVFAVGATGAPWIGALRVEGRATTRAQSIPVTGWNRGDARGIALFDGQRGARTDSATGRIGVALRTISDSASMSSKHVRAIVIEIDSTSSSMTLSANRLVLVAGASAPGELRDRLKSFRPNDTLDVNVSLGPVAPREAVGGFPVLLREGKPATEIATSGNEGFRGRNPRTAVALANNGRRLFLVTIDGRQPGYSVGMSLAEEAELLRSLGATDALNLDGGGSTALALMSGAGVRLANHPSDKEGERPVANMLGIVRGCTAAPASTTH